MFSKTTATPRLPVIFITSTSEEAACARAMQGGAVAFLTKPFDDETLLATLRTVLGECH